MTEGVWYNANSERPAYSKSGHASILAADSTDPTKATAPMTEADSGVNYLLVKVKSGVTLQAQDIELGAMEIKNATTDTRAIVGTNGGLHVELFDSSGSEVALGNPLPTAQVGNIDIGDISNGTQTNDVKVSLDSEVVSVQDNKASSAGTSTGVSVANTSTNVLVANSNRKEAIIVNDSDEVVYLKYGTGAAANSGIRLNAEGGTITETIYTGLITGICASGGKTVTVTEV